MIVDSKCSNGDLSLIDPSTGKKSYHREVEFRSNAAVLLPNCNIGELGSVDSTVTEVPPAKTNAPTMAPIRTVVESEVELTMSYDGWVKGGRRAFKVNIAESCGVEAKDVKIKGLKEKGAGERRVFSRVDPACMPFVSNT